MKEILAFYLYDIGGKKHKYQLYTSDGSVTGEIFIKKGKIPEELTIQLKIKERD